MLKTVETEDSSEKWYHFFKSPTLVGNMIGYFFPICEFPYINMDTEILAG